MPEKKDAFSTQVQQLGELMMVPILLFLGPAVGFVLGGWVDRKFQIYPWASFILTTLGLVGSGREITRLLKNILKEQNKKN